MAQLIEVPGQGVVEFPDNMTDAQISDAIRRSMGAQPPSAAPAQAAPVAAPAPAAPAPAEKSVLQSVDDRARWLANFVTLGFADKLAAKADEALGQGTYAQNLANQRLRSASAENDVTLPEKLVMGAAGIAPMVLAGGVAGAAASGARLAGAPAAVTSALSSAAAPTTLAGRVGLGVAEGGLLGAAEAVGRDTDVTEGSLIGAGIGAAVPVAGAAIGRLISPVTNVLTPEQQRLAQEMRARGFDLTPAQSTGSKFLGYSESVLRDLPGGTRSPRFGQQELFNEQVMRSAGIASKEVTPEVLESGFKQIGSDIGAVMKGKVFDFDAQYAKEIKTVADDVIGNLGLDIKPAFKNQLKELRKLSGQVSGEEVQKARTALLQMIRQKSSDETLVGGLERLRNVLDDTVEKSLPRTEAVRLKELRGQYKNLNRIGEAYGRLGAQAAAGNISPVALRQTVQRGATKDLEMLARGGDVFLRELPQSGTAPRQNVYNMITGAAGGAGLLAGGLPGLATALGSTVATPYAVNVAYNNPLIRRWLENQLASRAGRAFPGASTQIGRAATLGGLGLLD